MDKKRAGKEDSYSAVDGGQKLTWARKPSDGLKQSGIIYAVSYISARRPAERYS
jgi:hypothetical protein